MSTQDKNVKYHSDLKVKYETSLQKALAREDYDRVNEYSRALKVIHEHEKGNEINLGESDWEKQLKLNLNLIFSHLFLIKCISQQVPSRPMKPAH